MSRERMMRVVGIILEIGLAVFVVAVLVSAWKTPDSRANGSHAKKGKASASRGEALLPVQGTTVFSLCLQDDSNSGNVVQFNADGSYIFCCNGSVIASGIGLPKVRGGAIEIQHNPPEWRVLIKADTSVAKGTASVQLPPGSISCTISDRNMNNNSCICGLQNGN